MNPTKLGARAYEHIAELVRKIGPRPAGTLAEARALNYIETVLEIKRMLYDEGYTIAGLKRYWYRRKRNPSPPAVNDSRVKKVKTELKTILKMLENR